MSVNFVEDFVEFVFGKNCFDDSFEEDEEETLVQSLMLEKIVQTQNAWEEMFK